MATSTIGKTYTILNTVHLGDPGVFSSLPTLHYLGSVADNIGRVLIGRRQEAFRGFGLHTCYYALEEQERTDIEGKIMYLSDSGTRAPIEKNYCERWGENPSALTQNINAMKAEMRQPQGKNLFYLPMATLIGSELHVVALVVDTKDRQLFFLDSKGYRPSDLFVTQFMNRESSDLSCETVIQQVVAEGELEGYTLSITPNFQKVRDCAICVTVMVSMMARQRVNQPDQKLDLEAIFKELYANYARVDAIRAKCLAPSQ